MLHIKRPPPLAEVLIPAPAACVSTPPAPVFHHATSERQGNTGETKTSLNVRRANKAGDVTGGEHLKKKQGNPADSLPGNRAAALRFHGRNNRGPLLHFYIDIHCNRGFFSALMIQVCCSSITGVYRAALFR